MGTWGVGLYGNPTRTNAPPFVKLPTPEIEARIARLNTRLNALNEQLAALADRSSADLGEWVRRVAEDATKWEPVELI